MNERCSICGSTLGTGDVDGICTMCRNYPIYLNGFIYSKVISVNLAVLMNITNNKLNDEELRAVCDFFIGKVK